MSRTERHLSRNITVVNNGAETNYKLSVVTLRLDANNHIRDFSIEPFKTEEEGVTYHDSPLRLTIEADGSIKLSEEGRTLL